MVTDRDCDNTICAKPNIKDSNKAERNFIGAKVAYIRYAWYPVTRSGKIGCSTVNVKIAPSSYFQNEGAAENYIIYIQETK